MTLQFVAAAETISKVLGEEFAKKQNDVAVLDETVDGVMFRFVLNEKNDIAPWLWSKAAQEVCNAQTNPEELLPRLRGVLFIGPQPGTSARAFWLELEDAGYNMTHVLAQERVQNTERHYSVRFVFHRAPILRTVPEALAELLGRFGAPSLNRLTREWHWNTSVYRNPLADGKFGISVNCANRAEKGNSPKILRLTENRIVLE